MCGISVIAGSQEHSALDALKRMVASLHHRGPDGHDIKELSGCLLGHARLAVIDIEGGKQPMCDASGRFWITFNGEIFNYRELRKELEAKGAVFRTQSDTEIILQCYVHFGPATPQRLNGQFAFAIWDIVKQELFAARDRMGEKPFYFSKSNQGALVLASEIKALKASGLITPKIARASLDAFCALGYVPPDRTIYENVDVLPPGTALVYKDGHISQRRYWEPPSSTEESLSWRDCVVETRHRLQKAVERQMIADVPIGAFLSGGLDSTTIVALMSKTGRTPTTFSVGFGRLINELPYARVVAQTYGTQHHEVQMDIAVADTLQKVVDIYDEPLADSASIPTFLLSGFARQHVKVALAGEGGDELFGGYWWHQQLLDEENSPTSAVSLAAWRIVLFAARMAARAGLPARWQHGAARRYIGGLARRKTDDAWDRCLVRHWAPPSGFRQAEGAFIPGESLRPGRDRRSFDRVTDFDLRVYLGGDVLPKADRASMAQGLEIRSPFLDVELLEFVLSIPWRIRLEGAASKPLLRAAVGDLWPEAVAARKKQGFGAPVHAWVQEPDVRSLADRVTRHGGVLEHYWPDVRSEYPSLNAQQKWTFICLGLWLEKHGAAVAT